MSDPPSQSDPDPVAPGRPSRRDGRLRMPHGAFGGDRFGVVAERFARFFGTPRFIIGQTVLVVLWIALNGAAFGFRWDPYPFILLNLAFSTQAAYAAPLILLAQTRQADRDKVSAALFEGHRDEAAERQLTYEQHLAEIVERERAMTERHLALLRRNTELTERIAALTEELHRGLLADRPGDDPPATA